MTTLTLEHGVRNRQAKQMIETIHSHGCFVTRKKSGLKEALEDVANGRLTIIHTPKNMKINEIE